MLLKKLLYNHLESYDISSTITGKDGTEWITLKAINASFMQQGTYDLCPSGDCTFAVAPKNDQGYQMDNVTSFQLPNDEKCELKAKFVCSLIIILFQFSN